MALTEVNTEKDPGIFTNVQIGYDATHGIDIKTGIIRFTYARVHDAKTAFNASAKTASTYFQPHSNFTWRLEFKSDCRVAFKATDVDNAGGNQYAMVANGDSNVIEYFKVIRKITDTSGAAKTRTTTITNGVALRNGADIIRGQDAIYWYEGVAEYIDEADA